MPSTSGRRGSVAESRSRGEGTAERIFEAAVELFSRHGYDGVSVRSIAEHAGVHKGLVFYHFESKAKLFECVLDDYYRTYSRALADGLSAEGSLAKRLHRLLDANLDFLEEHLRYARLVQVEIGLGSDTLPRIRQGMSVLYDAVVELLKDVAPPSGPLASRHFFVSFSGMVNTYFLYAAALEPLWGSDPLSIAQRRERREHLHWMLDAIITRVMDVRAMGGGEGGESL